MSLTYLKKQLIFVIFEGQAGILPETHVRAFRFCVIPSRREFSTSHWSTSIQTLETILKQIEKNQVTLMLRNKDAQK